MALVVANLHTSDVVGVRKYVRLSDIELAVFGASHVKYSRDRPERLFFMVDNNDYQVYDFIN